MCQNALIQNFDLLREIEISKDKKYLDLKPEIFEYYLTGFL